MVGTWVSCSLNAKWRGDAIDGAARPIHRDDGGRGVPRRAFDSHRHGLAHPDPAPLRSRDEPRPNYFDVLHGDGVGTSYAHSAHRADGALPRYYLHAQQAQWRLRIDRDGRSGLQPVAAFPAAL